MMRAITEPTPAPIRVLLVEDDRRTADLTAEFFRRNRLEVTCASDAGGGLELAARRRFDAIVLDVMLPGRSGLDLCRELRARSDVPIVIVTALGAEVDRIVGLEIGADDYVVKPFSARELLARIRGLVRRTRGQFRPDGAPIVVGQLRIDPERLRATLGNTELQLSTLEFSILRALAERAGRVLSRDQLLELAHPGPDTVFERAIDVAVWRLRQKLGDDARRPRLLKTVRGAGYLLAADPSGSES